MPGCEDATAASGTECERTRPLSTLTAIRCALRERIPALLPDSTHPRGRAAVALVFGGQEHAPSLCFVKRTKRPGERWSGDMAFPGGWISPTDAGAHDAAVREAREEVGLDLHEAAYLGQLDDRPIAYPGVKEVPVLSSFVFYAGPALPALRPDGWETEAAYWISLEHLRRDANRTVVSWDTRQLPGIRYLDHVIWGLTLWVFQSFEAVVRAEVGPDI